MHQDTIEVFGCLFSRSDTRDKSTSLLDGVSHLFRIKGDHRIKERKQDDQDKVRYNHKPTWLLGIDIEVEFYPLPY